MCALANRVTCLYTTKPIAGTSLQCGYVSDDNLSACVCAASVDVANDRCADFCKDLLSAAASNGNNWQAALTSTGTTYVNKFCQPGA